MSSALLFAACGDGGTGPGDPLSDAEARALAAFIFTQSFTSANTAGVQSPAPVGGPSTAVGTIDITMTPPCPLGGTVGIVAGVSLTVDTATAAVQMDFAMIQTHDACRVPHQESGKVFTIDGAPDLTVDLRIATDGTGTSEVSGNISGALDWATDGRAGTCNIALVFTGTGDRLAGTGSTTLDGSMCGIDVSQTVSAGGV
ncbi:MAG: hypothetical protein OEZ65_05255 [Gemmatimonadota bacterium]|nr:hypothetical protein [Gemmatimonadota bacterium]